MKPGEKLARDICWAGFWKPGSIGKTKAAYWKSLPESTRKNYEADAIQFVWLLKRLPLATINMAHEMARPTPTPAAGEGEQGNPQAQSGGE